MPYETQPPEAIPERLEMEEARLGRGTYTDDTQMAIAVCESLLRRDGVDEDDLATTIAAAFDPERGYGPGTTTGVRLWREGVPVRDAAATLFGGEGSAGNGAAMRVAPVGLRFAHDHDRCVAEARRQARLTHAHPIGVDGAAAQAAAVAAAVRGDDHLAAALDAVRTAELRDPLRRAAGMAWRDAGALGATVAAHESVPAALLAATAPSFEEALTAAVRCGGDTDTVAAMAGAVAGARLGVEAIPARWLDALEDGPKGRTHVERLCEELAERLSALLRAP